MKIDDFEQIKWEEKILEVMNEIKTYKNKKVSYFHDKDAQNIIANKNQGLSLEEMRFISFKVFFDFSIPKISNKSLFQDKSVSSIIILKDIIKIISQENKNFQ